MISSYSLPHSIPGEINAAPGPSKKYEEARYPNISIYHDKITDDKKAMIGKRLSAGEAPENELNDIKIRAITVYKSR